MDTMQRWQRQAVMATAALMLLWLAGLLVLLALRLSHGELLRLHVLSRPNLAALQVQPIDDGRSGLVLQEVTGRISRIDAQGRRAWQCDAPWHFQLASVQPGDGMLVITGRYGQALAIDMAGEELWR